MYDLLSALHMFHTVAFIFFVAVYVARLIWLFRLRSPKDFSRRKGNPPKGIATAFALLFMPWAMESTRKHWPLYLEFGFFHTGLGLAITISFLLAYAPHLLTPPVNVIFAVFVAAGLVAGLLRMARRLARPEMRLISVWDDYFAIFMVNLFLFTCIFALLGFVLWQIAYFAITGVLLIYVPFSKISHYLYWPFARFFYGYELGQRGLVL